MSEVTVDPSERRRIEQVYAAWARERGLAPGAHDACYQGTVDAIGIEVETGVRTSGFYDVQIEMAVPCDVVPFVMKRGEPSAPGHPVIDACRTVLDEQEAIRSIRVGRDGVVARLVPRASPVVIDDVLAAVTTAVRDLGGGSGPFR